MIYVRTIYTSSIWCHDQQESMQLQLHCNHCNSCKNAFQANVALDSRFHRKRPIEHLSYNGKPVISGLQNALNGKWVTECACNDCIANGWQWRARFEIQRDRSACKLPYETNACCNRGRFHFLTNKRLMLRFNFTSAACWWYISHWSFEIQKTLLLFFVLEFVHKEQYTFQWSGMVLFDDNMAFA